MKGTAAIKGSHIINRPETSVNEGGIERFVAALGAAGPFIESGFGKPDAIGAKGPGQLAFAPVNQGFFHRRPSRENIGRPGRRVVEGLDAKGDQVRVLRGDSPAIN